jgi:hypothetical protein
MTVPVTRVVLRVLARADTADQLKAVLFDLAEARAQAAISARSRRGGRPSGMSAQFQFFKRGG